MESESSVLVKNSERGTVVTDYGVDVAHTGVLCPGVCVVVVNLSEDTKKSRDHVY